MLKQVTVHSRAEWREWLKKHYRQSESIWLVTYKKGSSYYVPRQDIVEEALCFGWIDSLPRALDDQRTQFRLSPRKAGSSWSARNKALYLKCLEKGLVSNHAKKQMALAQQDGSWERLKDVDALTVPSDLRKVLKEYTDAERYFERFSPSSRRGILEWIASAKRQETRMKRLQTTAELASQNIKAHHPEGRNKGRPLRDDE